MKYVITESQKLKLMLTRRLNDIDAMLHHKMIVLTRWYDVCDWSEQKFILRMNHAISQEMFDNYFMDVQEESQINELRKLVDDYILNKHINKIINFYYEYCNENQISESTENKFLRKLKDIDKVINRSLVNYFDRDSYDNLTPDDVIDFLVKDSSEIYFFSNNEDEYITGDDYDELEEFLQKYIRVKYLSRIITTLEMLQK